MIEPNLRETTYYRISQYVTFKWNYTSLLITPSAVNVVASCSLNDETYTISSNMTVQPTGAVTWDTNGYEATATVPLLTATYTLIVYDVDKSIDDIPSAGELSSLFGYRFGMYKSQPYTPLNGIPSPFFSFFFFFSRVSCGLTVQNLNAQRVTPHYRIWIVMR